MLSRCCRLEALWTSSASEGVFGYTTHATIRGCGFAFSTDAGLAGPVYCAESNNKLLNLGRLRRMKAQRLATDTTSLILARHAEYAPAAAQLQWEDSTPSAVAADAAAHVAFTVYGERESTHRCPMRALYVQHLLKARFHIVPGVQMEREERAAGGWVQEGRLARLAVNANDRTTMYQLSNTRYLVCQIP